MVNAFLHALHYPTSLFGTGYKILFGECADSIIFLLELLDEATTLFLVRVQYHTLQKNMQQTTATATTTTTAMMEIKSSNPEMKSLQ